jgi:hypothetical protein
MNYLLRNCLPEKINRPEGYGAIIAVRLSERSALDVQQLNPRDFRSSWVLAVPQVRSQASTDLLSVANCRVEILGLRCPRDRVGEKAIVFDLARYCGHPITSEVEALCKPAQKIVRWAAVRRGRGVLLERKLDFSPGNDLFWIGNENGELLK